MATSMTAPGISDRKRRRGSEPIVMVTAYDFPFARIVDEVGVDIILVGDSVGDNVLGMENTLSVTIADIAHHTAAVARARPSALIVADMVWMSYHTTIANAVDNAAELVRAGAEAVKLEGGKNRIPVVRALLDAQIPVMGHLGLTPQSIHTMGGLRVQARDEASAKTLLEEALLLEESGCFALVLEGVPRSLAKRVTEATEIPIIGIGAGPDCDGQVLVLHDLLGLNSRHPAKFVRRYVDLASAVRDAVASYSADVRSGSFPDDEESYH
ncbi:MAG TPA: 3-methyl-2-oxobutanoate hydroxymethyltransferase [Acidimicrobiales bacterium]|nr:3-methyl-2-oxobutanoate hydroxymethyltransferase [Acidimicrobiales bacterium]